MNRLGLLTLLLFMLLGGGELEGSDLLECYLRAKEHDPLYLSIYHEYQAQQTLPKQSWAQLLPQIQGSYTSNYYDYTEAPDIYNDYRGDRLNLILRQPVFNLTKLIDLDQNKLRALSGGLKLMDTKNNLMIRVSEAYFKHVYAIDYLNVLLEEQKSAAENLKMVGLLKQAGEATLVDLHDAEARKAEVEFRVIDGRNQEEITRQELERLIGDRLNSVKSLSEDMPIKNPSPENVEDWVREIKDNNPMVKYYALNSNIVKDEIRKQKAQHLPTLDLVGIYNKSDTTDYVKTPNTTYFAGGIQVSIPLWSSGYTTFKVREFRERHAQAVKDYERTLSDATQSLRTSFLGVHSSVSRIRSAQAYLNASQTALTSTRMGFKAGVRTVVDLLNATSTVYKAKGDLLQVRIDYVVQRLKLLYWNGRIDENAMTEINGYLTGRQ